MQGGQGEIEFSETVWQQIFNNQELLFEKHIGKIYNCANKGKIIGNYISENIFAGASNHSQIGIGGIVGTCDDIAGISEISPGDFSKLKNWIRDKSSDIDTWELNVFTGMWEIKQCYSSGTIQGGKVNKSREGSEEVTKTSLTNPSVGGILGYNFSNARISNAITDCYYKDHTVNYYRISLIKRNNDGGINGIDRPIAPLNLIWVYAKADDGKTSTGIQSIQNYINTH